MTTTVKFSRICGHSTDYDRLLCKQEMDAVPIVGECINIDGEPYVVHERSWAFSTDAGEISTSKVWCFIRLSPLQGPNKIK